MRLALLCLAIGAPAVHAAEPTNPADKPTVKTLQNLIGRSPRTAPPALAGLARGDSWRVSHYIGETEKGLVVAIGVATAAFSQEEVDAERAQWDGWDGTYGSEQQLPLVFVFARQADASLVPVGGLALPTAEAAHAEFGWGFSKLDDVDGDGKAELAVVYGYRSYHPGSTFGEGRRKEITWVSVEPGALAVQANLLTEERLGDQESSEAKTTYRFVPRAGSSFKDLRVTTEGDGAKKTTLWTYDAARDRWAPQG